jgi:hypothetical protein
MHLVGPWLSTTGKKKGKRKFRNAAAAQKSRKLDEEWQELLKKYDIDHKKYKKKMKEEFKVWKPDPHTYYRTTEHIPSRNPTNMSPALKKERPVYTGTLIKGIATMHKSNAVPIINDEQAVEISHMRR